MTRRFEYLVCNVQQARVTFVNGAWQGSVDPAGEDQDAALRSCESVWDYLQNVGYDGWELTAVVAHATEQAAYEMMYLRRER